MRIPKFILAISLVTAMLSAQAVPTVPDYSGSPGDTVSVVLSESDTNAVIGLGMVIHFDFESAFLTLNEVKLGDDWGALAVWNLFPDASTGPTAFISDLPRGAGSLLELIFTINDPPPATIFPYSAKVTFECPLPTTPGSFNGCEFYPFEQVVSTIDIDRQSAQIPLPGTLPLIALGMVALMWARRRPA